MKLNATLALGATIAAAALFAACGGGGDDANDNSGQSSSKITTQHGLAVAALYGNNSNVGGDLAGAAPAAETSDGSADDAVARNSGVSNSGSDLAAPQQVASDGTLGITVSGFGLATADPDTAILDLWFSRYGYCCDDIKPLPEPLPVEPDGGNGSSGSAPDIAPGEPFPTAGTVEPITEADLQPVIDALVAAGIARDDIEFTGQTYYDQYSASASLRASTSNIDGVQAALDAAQTAAASIENTSMSTSVSYTLEDCSEIEAAALAAAVTDANERGQQLADALNVGKGNIIGASDFSWSPSGSECASYGMPYPMYYDTSARSAAGTTANSVQVVAQISVTFALN